MTSGRISTGAFWPPLQLKTNRRTDRGRIDLFCQRSQEVMRTGRTLNRQPDGGNRRLRRACGKSEVAHSAEISPGSPDGCCVPFSNFHNHG